MCVAHTPIVMRLSETITIYLAAGAPFGAGNFLREQTSGSRFHIFLKAISAMILWPMTAAKMLLSLQRSDKGEPTLEGAQFIEKVNQAHRELLAALHSVLRLAQLSSGVESAKVERASCAVRETVEKYVGLTLAAAENDAEAQPSPREMESCRIAGRTGEDLLLAGRCIHRRNSARLITHQARSRTELLHALAEIREITGNTASSTGAKHALHLSVATVRFYSHVFNLLSLLEDETAARGVARLMDAECWRLRRLETFSQQEARATEEESCTRHATHTVFSSPPQTRALNQG
jgi:hypothetical protein